MAFSDEERIDPPFQDLEYFLISTKIFLQKLYGTSQPQNYGSDFIF